ncbi:MAG: hypothetical protein IPM98_10035 [Lewinellaceae bacterium]|nr:hypothetical protein [Lewinellaceae bacterium]
MKNLAFLLLLCSCTAPPQPVQPAFFHWQNRLDLSRPETALLNDLGCQTLYVKFLDIAKDPDGAIRPYSLLAVGDTAGLADRVIIPCVFITNSVFQNISAEKSDWLAHKIATALADAGKQFPQPDFPEIQFDCDWTGTTRAAFFSFLKKIRPLLPPETRLSATIRLHQYKFPDRTGVPPADRGLLMLYNTGDIHDPDEPNSIFQPAAAEKYLHGAPPRYPLPLDVALPVFSWTLVYRDGELWKIVPGENSKPKTQNSKLQYLRPDDLVRVETVDTALLRQAAVLASEIRLARDARVAFFHLDTSTVRRYPVGFLKSLCKTINDSR